jgi:putative transport protein
MTAAGRKYNLLAFVAVAGLWSLWDSVRRSASRSVAPGIFAGSMTSTATLQASLDVMHNSEPSIGCSVHARSA